VGETDDVERRLTRHNDARASQYTAIRLPVTLVYSELHKTRAGALKRERQIKRWTRAKKDALIAGDVQLLKRL
jgi:predicted GIY-YIG superfamily endonuclease